MTNILDFPATALVAKTVPKNAFYKRAKPKRINALKQFLTDAFENITWLYKLHPSTLKIAAGEQVQEIDVFHCLVKIAKIDPALLLEIDALIPRHTLFVLQYPDRTEVVMQQKRLTSSSASCSAHIETLAATELKSKPLYIRGQDMDSLYAYLLGQVSGLHTITETDYQAASALRKELNNLHKQLVALQNKIRNEKQFNLQVAMNTQAKQLKNLITEQEQKLTKILSV
ncbi:DUF4391 domain-containing protein [Capnocytophaga bilenii]